MKLSSLLTKEKHYRLIVVGGGTAGCAVASKFSRLISSKREKQIAVIEPNTRHYYQPGLTLAAAGLININKLIKNEKNLLPKKVDWMINSVRSFNPNENSLILKNIYRDEEDILLTYDYLVIATGLELRYDLIEGLPNGKQSVLEAPGICSIYFPDGALKTLALIKSFSNDQNAIFSFPNTPIKCGGAPLKICYLAEDIFRERQVRDKSRVIYCTSLGAIFGVPKYSNELMSQVNKKGIELYTRMNLAKVEIDKRIAIFNNIDESGQIINGKDVKFKYDILHIGAPCSPVTELRNYSKLNQNKLTDAQGFVNVNPNTLQSINYKNIFAIGDCANTPNAKTAAAVSSQLKSLTSNLMATMEGKELKASYDGYSSCPLLVDRKHVILAEFNSNGPIETFPYNQSKATRFAYLLKRYLMPPLYWFLLLRGYWLGPERLRKMLHPFDTIKSGIKLK